MVSSDDKIPEQTLKMVDAFLSKDEAADRLLPVITHIAVEASPCSQKDGQTAPKN